MLPSSPFGGLGALRPHTFGSLEFFGWAWAGCRPQLPPPFGGSVLPFHSLPTVPQRGLPLHSLREGAGAHRGSVGGLRPLPKTWGDWLSTFAKPPKTSPLSPLIAFPPFVPLPPTLLHSNWCHGGASPHHALFIGYRTPSDALRSGVLASSGLRPCGSSLPPPECFMFVGVRPRRYVWWLPAWGLSPPHP